MFDLRNKKLLFLIFIFNLLFFSVHVSAFKAGTSTSAGQQRSAEKGLKDNRYFMYYINSTVSNFGSEQDKNAYKTIIQRDLLSQFFYMRYFFGDSWKEIYKAQNELIILYRKLLASELKIGKKLLNEYAAKVINSKDVVANRYLYLGYRKAKQANIFMVMSDNYRPTLYSLRLHKYVRAMKKIKEAKRYAVLALLQINLTPEEKSEKEKKPQLYTYEKIKEKIEIIAKEKNILLDYSLHHLDSYYKYKEKKSYFDIVWEDPKLEDLKEYQEYLKAKN